MEKNILVDAALGYLGRGFSVIPVKPDKKPFLKWEEYQKRRPTSEEVGEWWAKWPSAMIGIVTGAISGVSVIDVDESQGHEELQKCIPDSLLMPTVKTPRGGQHLYFKTPSLSIGNNARIIPGCDFRGEGGYVVAPPSVNGTGKAYEWLPGLSIAEIFPPALPHAYINKINSMYIGGSGKKTKEGHVTDVTDYFKEGQRDDHIFHAANCLIKGGASPGFALNVLERIIKTIPPGSHPLGKNIAEIKIKSVMERAERKERNIHAEVREWVEGVTSCDFSVTDVGQDVTLVTKEQRAACRKALQRLKEEGIIEPTGKRVGFYRKKNTEFIQIDLKAPKSPRLQLEWPLGIEDYVYINPKSIVVIAGETDAGKTAFNISFAARNKDKHRIHWFTSEMGGEDMQDRLALYGEPLDFWSNVDFKEKETNFEDLISPDDINIIDYLSAPIDKIWTIKEPIDKIFYKLKKGIAIISLQMGKGQSLPYGQSWGIERSRLAITLSKKEKIGNVCEIIKAKNWVNPKVRPTGLKVGYWIINGARFEKKGEWG